MVILELIHAKCPTVAEGLYLLDTKPMRWQAAMLVIHDNLSGSHGLAPATYHSNFCPINFDGRIVAYHGFYG